MLANYHTHTTYCDGKEEIEVFIKKALELKLQHLGFSSHAPISIQTKWAISDENMLEKYSQEILAYKNQYQNQIELFLSLEIDYIPNTTASFAEIKSKYNLDYTIGSIHLVKIPNTNDIWFVAGKSEFFEDGFKKYFNFDIKKAVKTYYHQICEMIENEPFDIIAHFDKIKLNADKYFDESEKWYIDAVNEALWLMKGKNIILEANTRSFYQKKRTDIYPSDFIIEQARLLNIPIIVNSDAHHSNELTEGFEFTFAKLKQYGYKSHIIRNSNRWEEIEIK